MDNRSGPYRLSAGEEKRSADFFKNSRIPPAVDGAIIEYIAKKTGKSWNDPVVLERLRRAIVAQKAGYWKSDRKRKPAYTKGYSVLGYLAYHFPVYFMQTEYILQDLAGAGLLKPEIVILDVGTGPGVVPLAVADFFSRLDHASASVFSIERSEENIEAFRFLRQAVFPVKGNTTLHTPVQADIREIDDRKIPGPVDLLVFSNVVNELETATIDDAVDLVMQFSGHVRQDGTILIVEPAEEVTATRLRVLTRALQDRGLTVHSPCPVIRATRCDPSRCWSFMTRPTIYPTRLMETLAACDEAYRYLNTDIKYAYAILRKDGTTRQDVLVPPQAKVARLSKLHQHINRSINVVAAKMSQDLGDRKTHVFKICDGTAAKPAYVVLPEYYRTASNDLIMKEPYGGILEFRQVIVRYNRQHDAYNLLANRNTGILRYGETAGSPEGPDAAKPAGTRKRG